MSNEMRRAKLMLLSQCMSDGQNADIFFAISKALADEECISLDLVELVLYAIDIGIGDTPEETRKKLIDSLIARLV